MGLAEQLLAGAVLTRKSTTFTTAASGSGSVSIDASYAILGIQISNPCRIRFYENTSSRDDSQEINRAFGNRSISSSVALVGDFSMSTAERYSVDPILFSVSQTFSSPLTYYRIEPSASTTVVLNTFTLEDSNVAPGANPAYIIDNRRLLPMVSASLSPGQIKSGSITDSNIPQTYLLINASGSDATNIARLRLYSTSGSLYDSVEKSRVFSVEPSASAYLIVDMILSGSTTTCFSPKIIGSNLANMGNNLLLLRGNQSLISGKNEMYYLLENADSLGSATSISASVSIFALEG